ncbi:MAG: lamin tail domain-containing protein [Halapricum sp.]
MSDRTVWSRLEPRPRKDEMTDALRAPIRDPLWMLSRQWQVSEFQGEDGGSPVKVDLDIAEDRLTRVDLKGGGRGEEGEPAGPFDYEGGPLESIVEREEVMTDDDGPPLRLRAEAGQQFLRTLADAGYGSHSAGDFPEALRLEAPERPLESTDRRYVELMDGRALDGTEVARAIRSAVGNIDDVVAGEASSWSGVSAGDLPVPTEESRNSTFDECCEDFYGWYVGLYDEPTTETGSAWDPTRLEYRFAVATGAGGTETVLEAPEYHGGHLDWYAFSSAEEAESLGTPEQGGTPTEGQLSDDGQLDIPAGVTAPGATGDMDLSDIESLPLNVSTVHRSKTVVPTQISFPGMPANRWWELEDGDVDIAQATDDGASLARLLLVEFAAQYGNDWFRIGLDTPVGTLTRLTDLTVTDSFGVSETAEPAIEDDWKMFMHELPRHDEPGLFVPPTLADSVTGDPVEKVVFTRDEMANLAFAIERIVESPTGQALDRTEFQEPELVIDRVVADSDPDAEYVELANPGEDRLVIDDHTIAAETDGTATEVYTFGQRTLGPGETFRVYTGAAPEPDVIGAGLSASAWTDSEAVTISNADDRVVVKKLLARPSDALADYRLSTDVPDYWFPFTPEQGWNFKLERALLLDASTLGLPIASLPRPLGEILRPEDKHLPEGEDTYQIHEEEVTRSGREITRRYQHARWTDGASHLWSSRESRVADTQLASGLRFDILDERE